MLALLPVTFTLAVSPVFRILCSHITVALDTSRNNEWANRVWWDWAGSWVICSGPAGRWPVGVILGFVVIENDRPRDQKVLPGYLIEEPHLSVFATAAIVLFLSCFCLVSNCHLHAGSLISSATYVGIGHWLYSQDTARRHYAREVAPCVQSE